MLNRRTLCLILCCLMLPVCSYAAKPSDKPPASEDVEKAIQKLENALRRINGYRVMHYETGGRGTTPGDVVIEGEISLHFCLEEDYDGSCNEFSGNALTLQTGIFPTSYQPQVFTFDDDNSSDFDAIVEQLTNGNANDRAHMAFRAYRDGQPFAGGGYTPSEGGLANKSTPIAPSFGAVDFEDLEIGSISVRVKRLSSSYNPSGYTEYEYEYEVFYEMPQ